MPTDNPMTYQEVIDNYEYKVAKKMLMREYPWIKGVFMNPSDEEVNKYNLIFVDIIIDPYEMCKQYGWTMPWWVTSKLDRGEDFWSPYLSTYLEDPSSDKARELLNDINDDLRKIHNSPALPVDMRLPGTRKIQIGSFHTAPNLSTTDNRYYPQSSD